MELSYWEHKSWFSNVDFTIIGSGIVGLNCALSLKEKYPKSNILVLERGSLPQGASTKNAGFACFGSVSELLADLEHHTEQEVAELVQKRWNGIQRLRNLLGDSAIGFELHGSHELFPLEKPAFFEKCMDSISYLNDLMESVFGEKPFLPNRNLFGFENIQEQYITHVFEGQLDTGKMMRSLIQKCLSNGIPILYGVEVEALLEAETKAVVKTKNFEFDSKQVFVATNGFASKLLKSESIKPARAQVLITEPIKNLHIKGTFHFDEGYYYFRNIDNRILFGGGRNLDFDTEETTEFGHTEIIQNKLEALLNQTILPHQNVKIERRWSGIMGVGNQKSPIVKPISNSIFCGVRLGGMGVALGSLVGKELADLADL
ncbi:NAD(P)/FAD-dependent oxidoreductase [Flagellimonas zhangzhouensis]|uniref:Glycine/D-amino acid oxidase n=1 Tax=Flagellimonas zhangzhouensis TaxID=1073328 RepID=A0A1H2UY27_9FLAO|nr:FAD-dependent oxidoreductase [Allomuricauda zhangzhouensis]SDQ12909.1 Glycine/D-amino acid oxidase [Allomuricauda zhangzhouensis]SDW60524.1 Glycine/D-amino acid oxidase [Allomuricauda zhangzhouensis]